jgi:Domain of unknown function (DUF4352)
VTRLLALVLVAACLAGCGSGGDSSTGSSGPKRVTTLPTSGTVTYTDGRVYTVAPLGDVLHLDDIDVKVLRVDWKPKVDLGTVAGVAVKPPPGTKTFGVVTLTVTNKSRRPERLGVTQIWLRNAAGSPYLASATARVPDNLLRMPIPAGKSVTGALVFPAPQEETGYLLVYRFDDSKAIAKASHVGLLRYAD